MIFGLFIIQDAFETRRFKNGRRISDGLVKWHDVGKWSEITHEQLKNVGSYLTFNKTMKLGKMFKTREI